MLFPRPELETYSFATEVSEEQTLRGLARLAHLQHLHRIGFWSRLKETSAEQSFVERVFGDIFGYATLLKPETSEAIAEVFPRLYVPLPNAGRAYPDFALGHFRADRQLTVVTAELKSPGADLDAPQSGSYGGRSAVQQAMDAAQAANAEWCIVSNMLQIRLYRVPDVTRHEILDLLEVTSPAEFRRGYSLFARRSLLGGLAGERSPLSILYSHTSSGESMLVPPQTDRVRVVHRVRPFQMTRELAFSQLTKSLAKALQDVPGVNVVTQEFLRPKLQGDQLVFERRAQERVWQRIALFKSGVVVCSYTLPLGAGTKSSGQTTYVDPSEVGRLLCQMLAFCVAFYRSAGIGNKFVCDWSLEDLSERVAVNDEKCWTRPTPHTALSCQPGVARMVFPETTIDINVIRRDYVFALVNDIVGELLFPFEGTDIDGRLCRLEPSANEMKAVLVGIDAFNYFT